MSISEIVLFQRLDRKGWLIRVHGTGGDGVSLEEFAYLRLLYGHIAGPGASEAGPERHPKTA